MARLIPANGPVFIAPTKGRAYLTKGAAASAEARAMLARKYPTEREDRDSIGMTNRGWHWSEDERLQRVHARLSRLLRRAI